MKKLGDSLIQRKSEILLLLGLAQKLGIEPAMLHKKKFLFKSRRKEFTIEVDGYCEKPPILCEAWAHIGTPKPAQKSKILKDALKLIFLEKKLRAKHQKILVFADEEARKSFISGSSWATACLCEYRFDTLVIPLSATQTRMLKKVQKDQYR
jgi:hypothetical protein